MKRRDYPPTESDIPMHGFSPYHELHRERIRAHAKHKDKPGGSMEMKPYTDPDWLPVVVEEVGEVAKVICDHRHGLLTDVDHRRELREELVQVGAMVAAWISAIDLAYCGAQRKPGKGDEVGFDTECARPPDHDGAHVAWSGRERGRWADPS